MDQVMGTISHLMGGYLLGPIMQAGAWALFLREGAATRQIERKYKGSNPGGAKLL